MAKSAAVKPPKKTAEKQTVESEISVFADAAGRCLGCIYMLCSNDRALHGLHKLFAHNGRVFPRSAGSAVCGGGLV